MLAIVPEALSVRSHSMTQSSRVLDCFRTFGLAYDCNHFIPAQAGMVLKPWHHWNGLTKVPYFWEDDVSLIYSSFSQPKELCCAEGLKVFDFHPIHVFLNSESLARYDRVRQVLDKPSELLAQRFKGEGTRARLERLLELNK